MKITLGDTITNMTSNDYKKRFCAEYWQTKIRYERLKQLCRKIEAAQIANSDFCTGPNCIEVPPHDCPYELLCEQLKIMGNYLKILEVRAVIEDVMLAEDLIEV